MEHPKRSTTPYRALQIIAGLVALSLIAGGCAITRSQVALGAQAVANPASGTALKIVQVDDGRVFEINPRQPSIPSLKDDEIGNKEITARAVARKRGGFGKAFGDVLLPEGQTVAKVVKEALTRGFRESGYRVLQPGDAGYEEARPITASINQFWAWFTPGFWAITLECQADVQIRGDAGPFQAGDAVQAYARQSGMAATDDSWKEIVEKGVEDLVKNLRAKLEGK